MATTTSAPASVITWKLDPAHSSAEFKVKHMMISNVKGRFSGLNGTLLEDPADPARSTVEASIDVSTVNTHDEQRDGHLKSADFLHVQQFPAITFKSRKVEPAGSDEFKVTGDLTIHGVTKQVVLQVEGPTAESKDPFGNVRIGLSATTKIKRSDFGLTWNATLETGGILVGDDLKIEIDASAIKKA